MTATPKVLKVTCPNCQQKMDVGSLPAFTCISCPVCNVDVIVPKVFAGITLEEPVGEGSLATVYRALEPTLDREVAVKILKAEGEPGDFFLAQARKAAAVNHANVIPIYSCGVEEGKAYVVMQFMPGGTLEERLAGHKEGEISFVLKCGLAIARSLEAMQRKGIVHGALHPSNVLFDGEGNIKLADFGQYEEHGEKLRLSPKNRYASVEYLADGVIGHQGDLFSLGVILYELTTRHPSVADSNPEAVVAFRTSGKLPTAPAQLVGKLPPGLSDMIMSLMAYRPEDRPDCEKVISFLSSFSEEFSESSAMETQAVKRTLQRPQKRKKKNFGEVALPSQKALRQRGRRGAAVLPASPAGESKLNVALVLSMVFILILLGLFVLKKRNDRQEEQIQAPVVEKVEPVEEKIEEPVAPKVSYAGLHLGRPRPSGFDFSSVKEDLKTYFSGLPEGEMRLEKLRIGQVENARAYLIKLMKYTPYRTPESGIRLPNGRTEVGEIPYCNESQIGFRGRNGSAYNFSWDEVDIALFLAFYRFYINERIEKGGHEGDGKLTKKQQKEIADDYLTSAILADWYEAEDQVQECVARAIKFYPACRGQMKRLFPETAR